MAIKIDTSKIKKELEKRINETLKNEAAKAIQQVERMHVYEDVYGAYGPPRIYGRRGESGGLADVNNMTIKPGNMEITVTNETPFNNAYDFRGPLPFIPPPNYGNNLAMLIEKGNGGGGHIYNYPYPTAPGDFRPARPFIQNTYKELMESSGLRMTIISGLRRRGIDAT